MIEYKNITLRPIKETDLLDYVRWTTVETEWMDWDAPWDPVDPGDFAERQRKSLAAKPATWWKLEIDNEAGRHIGWVSAYDIDGDAARLAVGIDIPAPGERGKRYGEQALAAYIAYLFRSTGAAALYTQTWAGNTAMLRLAEKIGFDEIFRVKKQRMVRGETWDGLTFSLTQKDFRKNYPGLFQEKN